MLLAAKIAGRAGRRARRPGCTPDGVLPRTYHPDHIRRLTQMVYGLIGLVIAAVAGGVIAIAAGIAGGAWGALVTAAWIADGLLAAVSVGEPAGHAGWCGGVYRRRRAELDAAGAEVVGEFHARIANRRREDTGLTRPRRHVCPVGTRRTRSGNRCVIKFCCPPNSYTAVPVGWTAVTVGRGHPTTPRPLSDVLGGRGNCWARRPNNAAATVGPCWVTALPTPKRTRLLLGIW